MTLRLDPQEILAYLNEMGYYNITNIQLKEFIRDLKKLIKYDQQQSKENIDQENQHNIIRKEDIFNALYSSSTASSRAKCVSKKSDNFGSLQNSSNVPKSHHTTKRLVKTANHSKKESVDQPSQLLSKRECTCESPKKSSSAGFRNRSPKSKSSYIKPRIPQPNSAIGKNDPVTLYHWYESEWRKQKLPGENKHSNLRWAIREKMLKEPQLIRKSVSTITSTDKFQKGSSNRI